MELTIRPDFRDLIPPLTTDERMRLMAEIVRDGCRDPIVVWQGHNVILDGHNRYEICTANGIEFATVEKMFTDENAAMHWMICNQFARRNLTPMMRAELALKLEPLIEQKAAQRKADNGGDKGKAEVQKSAPPPEKSKTRDEVAKLAGVSHDTITKAKKLLETAPREVVDKVRSGEVKINTAYRQVNADSMPAGPQKVNDSMPFSVRSIEKQFASLKTAIHDMAHAAEIPDESDDAGKVFASLERCRKAFATLSRKCASRWMELNRRSESDGDCEEV